MKIRTGFITNSSSTNFLIISKKELSADYLYKKLGFKNGSPIAEQGRTLCDDIMRAISYGGIKYYDVGEPDYESIKKIFGEKSAMVFKQKTNYHVYWGHTNSDESPITQFFTTDSFEIEQKDFYLNGRACIW